MREDILRRLSEISEEEQAILHGGNINMRRYNYTGGSVFEPEKILPSGHLFGITTHTRFVDFPQHSHSYVEMVYQVSGSTTHIIGRRDKLRLTAGKLLLLGRGTEHEILAAAREDVAVNFILVPAFFDNAAMSLGSSNALSVFLKNNLGRDAGTGTYLIYDVAGSTILENLLENLVLLELEGAPVQRQELQRATLELLLRHLSGRSEDIVIHDRRDRERATVLSALSRIESDVRCSLAELAAEYDLTPPALSRLIRRHTGCTFTELLHTARFNRAAALLKDTELSVADIALAVGYENTAFFYRRFEDMYGCPPAQYRAGCR